MADLRGGIGSDGAVLHLVVSWVLMIPLVCYAANGTWWFQGGGNSVSLGATYGVLASGQTDTANNVATAILLMVILSVVLLPKMKSLLNLCLRDRVFGTLSVWAFASCLWSQLPMVSLEWAPSLALNTLFAFYLYQRFSPGQQMRLLLMLGWACLVSKRPVFPSGPVQCHTLTMSAWEFQGVECVGRLRKSGGLWS